MKRCVLSLERNIGREDEFRVSGGSEFQRRGPMTEKALFPSDDRTYGMERTSELYNIITLGLIKLYISVILYPRINNRNIYFQADVSEADVLFKKFGSFEN